MELSLLEYLQGLFSFIFVLITITIGIIIITKYLKVKKWQLLVVGIGWVGMPSGYYPDAINFILIIFFDTTLNSTIYLLLATSILFPALCLWLFVITNLINLNNRKLILIIFFIICATFEIIILSLLFIDSSLIGILINPFTVEFSLFAQVSILFALFVFIIFGFLFTKVSLASEKPEIKLKGNFLLIAFICFLVGLFLEVVLPITPLTIVIIRLILVSSSIEFYIGYILPDWIKNAFLKK